jgi:hypothetical protein
MEFIIYFHSIYPCGAEPVRRGEELVVSYGRYWWKARRQSPQGGEEEEELHRQEDLQGDIQRDADQPGDQHGSLEQGQCHGASCHGALHRDAIKHEAKPADSRAPRTSAKVQPSCSTPEQKGRRFKGTDQQFATGRSRHQG